MIIKELPKFKTDKELFDHLVNNEEEIFAQAKMEMKKADGLGFNPIMLKGGIDGTKSIHSVEELLAKTSLQTKLSINTTNVFDSHLDLHIPKMWNRSIKNNKRILHLQEHSRRFKDIIAKKEDLKVYVETRTWKSLGFDMEGKTEVLTFDSNIKKSQNEFMFEQYAKGNVDEHSVGMIYVKMVTCINDEDYPVQLENWEKYYPMGVNPKALGNGKFFWAILEAKCIEGSAVTLGSNSFTPTQSIKEELTIEQKTEQATKKWLGLIE